MGSGWSTRVSAVKLFSAGRELEPRTHDPEVLHRAVTHASIDPVHHTLDIELDGALPLLSVAAAPWTVRGPHGVRIVCDAEGTVTFTPAGTLQYATPENLERWAGEESAPVDQRLLVIASGELLSPWDITGTLQQLGVHEEAALEATAIDTLGRMIMHGAIEPGERLPGGPDGRGMEFRPWDLPFDDAIERVGTVWSALGGSWPRPDQVAWFRITAEGRAQLSHAFFASGADNSLRSAVPLGGQVAQRPLYTAEAPTPSSDGGGGSAVHHG